MSYENYGTGAGSVGKKAAGKMWDRPAYQPKSSGIPEREGSDHSHYPSGASAMAKPPINQEPVIEEKKGPGKIAYATPLGTERSEIAAVEKTEDTEKPNRKPPSQTGYSHYDMRRDQEKIHPLLSDTPISPKEVADTLADPTIDRQRAWKVLKSLVAIGAADKPDHGVYVRKGPMPDRIGNRQGEKGRTMPEAYDAVYEYLCTVPFSRALVIANAIGETNQRVSNALKRLHAHGKIEKHTHMQWKVKADQLEKTDDSHTMEIPRMPDVPEVPEVQITVPVAEIDAELGDLLRSAIEAPEDEDIMAFVGECPYFIGAAILDLWQASARDNAQYLDDAIWHINREIARRRGK